MLTAALIIFGLTLIAVAVCFYRIGQIERFYARLFNTEETIPTWKRKRWGFGLLLLAHLVGFSRLIYPTQWTPLVFLVLACTACWLFASAYGLFLQDVETLTPRGARTKGSDVRLSKENHHERQRDD